MEIIKKEWFDGGNIDGGVSIATQEMLLKEGQLYPIGELHRVGVSPNSDISQFSILTQQRLRAMWADELISHTGILIQNGTVFGEVTVKFKQKYDTKPVVQIVGEGKLIEVTTTGFTVKCDEKVEWTSIGGNSYVDIVR